ncbi:hypothetical protein RO3G_00217 [Rhizopus delemar RA 99-880]|uniref:Uncharacterized protein n=1 Tax=Rhizopus delemar (strain RA 99-880 / ATCC MYA-4621 / FGSC 9543 / NRRL 43880) TaxID=246409 RepID=I1BH33_RHIO9|nr:hypothetical protein RO3G_00217 [Rhizopus delemar RA 99-880]|eukprot:EIE75513.1 hypothetical protein RO3G_00217 [Rhizopus delemar RA 99-880]
MYPNWSLHEQTVNLRRLRSSTGFWILITGWSSKQFSGDGFQKVVLRLSDFEKNCVFDLNKENGLCEFTIFIHDDLHEYDG